MYSSQYAKLGLDQNRLIQNRLAQNTIIIDDSIRLRLLPVKSRSPHMLEIISYLTFL